MAGLDSSGSLVALSSHFFFCAVKTLKISIALSSDLLVGGGELNSAT
jgi:hypothetical protein